jgi:hypothetical protein
MGAFVIKKRLRGWFSSIFGGISRRFWLLTFEFRPLPPTFAQNFKDTIFLIHTYAKRW